MWNEIRKDRLNSIPRLYQTEHIALPDKTIHAHFFLGSCDWYICEYDGGDLFWGFACLNGDLMNAEWGLIPYSELKTIKVKGLYEVEHDEYWQVRPASEVNLICQAQGWVFDKQKSRMRQEG
ncbi:MAG: DUF2958 domain-containing protein [Desulfobacula sp.]|nr:DUF2958 domain-containing protein [Desulfobacula sp.]